MEEDVFPGSQLVNRLVNRLVNLVNRLVNLVNRLVYRLAVYPVSTVICLPVDNLPCQPYWLTVNLVNRLPVDCLPYLSVDVLSSEVWSLDTELFLEYEHAV